MKNSRSFISLVFLLIFSFGRIANAQSDAVIQLKADSILRLLTLEEKVHMLHAVSGFASGGVSRLGIPDMAMTDGPHGIRIDYVESTYFPTGVCLAATWNPALGHAYGAALGQEAAFRKKNVLLGPGINIIRSPLNGRNFEYMSEDPYLISRMAPQYIQGIQEQGVIACVKHFAANNQETKRTVINVEMSERALREIYLPGFKAAVTEGKANAVMGAYNKFRGEWASHNNYLLKHILKDEWHFKGVVISDWAAIHSTMQALWNGCDIEMGTNVGKNWGRSYMGDTVVALTKAGKVQEYVVDDKVRRILFVMLKAKMIGTTSNTGSANTKEHQQVSAKIAEEGMVLLKNENHLLPLPNTIKNIAVIGGIADRKLANGGGSSGVRPFYEITPLEGFKNIAGNATKVNYAMGYMVGNNKANDSLIQKAVNTAASADVAIVVAGWTHIQDNEGADKTDMNMPWGQNELINAVRKANPKTIVVLSGGSPLDIRQWKENVPAILQAWYPGMEGGNVLAKIIFGQINPSGKLPMTFPKALADCPAHVLGQYPGDSVNVYYNDDIYVGYRYFDTYKVAPQYAFGHGLSYTSFSYGNLQIKKNAVEFTITNNGRTAGAEVAQLYIKSGKSALPRPEKELKGFEKIFLKAGETKKVVISLSQEAFSYFNDLSNRWEIDPTANLVLIGSSSADIRLQGTIDFQNTGITEDRAKKKSK
ncbi:glycoside hydrolase family 3 C-terminal domain-containing protein [Pinibacter soli]|uniref:Glycoside hydrolase family 3 C-terminal domain-containing protein n=1 Tax=Pinibacter soli TaxID=3044211 RepID=A0ABT6R906_9BACT|nr:glycoside hydrolase family 3 C-terminal domain-containing protein [Pinibacter soli]MDI3318374.1 glycoside hydrolase family 3 C-terminal domain-containing protein [Pinibacter soli]